MVINDSNSAPMAEAEPGLNSEYFSMIVSHGFGKEPRSSAILPLTSDISLFGGGYIGLNNWAGCLASSRYKVNDEILYLYFPSSTATVPNIIKWFSFIRENYGLDIKYLGEYYVHNIYYGKGTPGVYRSHLIGIPRHKALYEASNHGLLLNVTMVRYLYRPAHYQYIIEAIYKMVDAGLNPWDALILAHYNFNAHYKQENLTRTLEDEAKGKPRKFIYSGGTSIHYAPSSIISMVWPRSKDTMIALFDKLCYINGVFGGLGFDEAFLLKSGPERTPMICPPYRSSLEGMFLKVRNYAFTNIFKRYFDSPYSSIFDDDLSALLLQEKWVEAYNLYVSFLKETALPLLKDFVDKKKKKLALETLDVSFDWKWPAKMVNNKFTPNQTFELIVNFIEELKPLENGRTGETGVAQNSNDGNRQESYVGF